MTSRNAVWIVTIAAALTVALTMGIRQSMGAFLPLFEELTDSGRQWFGFAIAMQNLLWGLASPFFGAVADRYGAHKAVAVGGVLYVVGLLVMRDVSAASLLSGQIFIGLGLAGCGMSVALGAVAKISTAAKRSMLLGLVSAAGSFGQFALVPVATEFLDHFGWVGALLALSAVAACIVPIAFGMAAASSEQAVASSAPGMKRTLVEGLHHRSYLLLTAGFFVCGFQVVFIATHLISYLQDSGITPAVASWSLALIGLFNIVGTLACGWLGGRYRKKNVLTLLYLLRSLVILIFLITPLSPTSALAFGVLIGLLWLGTVPLTNGLVSYFFDVRYVTLMFGIVFFSHQFGSFLGAWLGGWVFEVFQSYTPMWALAIFFGLLAAMLHYPIKESPPVLKPLATAARP